MKKSIHGKSLWRFAKGVLEPPEDDAVLTKKYHVTCDRNEMAEH